MTEHILLVDDDVNILAAYQRQLRKRFSIVTAPGPEEGLEEMNGEKQFAVILSDMQMPGMNGVEFLQRVKEISPNSVRLMLTGNADQKTAVEAINDGAVFRFLNKPCSTEDIAATIDDALTQFRLITAEKELLEQTLKGSIGVLTDILSIVNPAAFGRANQIQEFVRRICERIPVERPWELEIAAMLSQLGCVTVPEDILGRVQAGEDLSADEMEIVRTHPSIAGRLIRRIPRLNRVAELIECQMDEFADVTRSDNGLPAVEMRILKAAMILESYVTSGVEAEVAIGKIKQDHDFYGADLLEALEDVVQSMPSSAREIELAELKCGMVVSEAMRNMNGQILVAMGQEITEPILARLRNFARNTAIQEPILILDAPRVEAAIPV